MDSEQLLEYVFGRGDLYSPSFSVWIRSSERFKLFVERYKDKIRKKIADAQKDKLHGEDALRDVLYELEMAYLILLCDQFTDVEYERYGAGDQRAPDFTVTFETGAVFNVEVKRIRESLPEVRLETWKRVIRDRIVAIPSSLALSIRVLPDRIDDPATWLDRLEKETPNIIEYVQEVNAFHQKRQDISADQTGLPHPVPGFEGEIELSFRKPYHKTTHVLDWYGGEFPVFNTGREHKKFGDAITYSLGQLWPCMINVLAISTASNTHGWLDFGSALESLAKLIADDNDDFFAQKGYADANGFLDEARKLSGVLFRSAWVSLPTGEFDERNVVWSNPDADLYIPPEIAKALREMD